mgnify:CR=1 FL=1
MKMYMESLDGGQKRNKKDPERTDFVPDSVDPATGRVISAQEAEKQRTERLQDPTWSHDNN